MGTAERISRLVRANVNDALRKAADPMKLSELQLEELRKSLRSLKQALVASLAEIRRMERAAEQNEQDSRRWYDRARFALEKGREDLARQALARRRKLQQTAEAIRTQIQEQRNAVAFLKADLKRLEARLEQLHQQRLRAIARSEYEREVTSRPERSSSIPPEDVSLEVPALEMYERIVAQVEDLEIQVAAMDEVYQTDTLEKQFAELETQDEIERDLEALKVQLAQKAKASSDAHG